MTGLRQSRKLDHLHYTMELRDGPGNPGFADIRLIHNCLPDISWEQISLNTSLASLQLNHPIIINAITGGAADVTKVNKLLAEFAVRTGSAMAVGSQYSALESREVWESYQIVRRIYPKGIIFANLGAHATPRQAQSAIDMIGANALQIHLNTAQEIMMTEGDRDFRGYLENIAAIASAVSVPVIVKEVGCGIAREAAKQLTLAGIQGIDVGGIGGTNFISIETARSNCIVEEELLEWGIPTVISAFETVSVLPDNVDLIVSGGVRTSLDCVKSLAIGAKAVAIAAPVLRKIDTHTKEVDISWFQDFLHQIKRYMLLIGAKEIDQLATKPLIISGFTREWLSARSISISQYGQRSSMA